MVTAVGGCGQLGAGDQAPADEPTVIKGLFTGEGLTWLTTTLGENYIGFPPLVTVLLVTVPLVTVAPTAGSE